MKNFWSNEIDALKKELIEMAKSGDKGVQALCNREFATWSSEIADSIDALVAANDENIEEAIKKYHPEGTDLVIDATGVEECIQSSLRIAKRGGTVVLAGYGRGKIMNIRIDDIHVKNLKLIGAGNNWNQHK